MAQAHLIAIGKPVALPAPRPDLVLRVLGGAVALLLAAGCCSLAIALAAPGSSHPVDRSETNSFGSSVSSAAFTPQVTRIVRVPDADGHLQLRGVPCATPRAARGTRCFAPR
jgi:hypothetical protein